MIRNHVSLHPRPQRGMALLVVLLLLLVTTILGLASMRGALLEERMSGNLYDRSLMFQAAEAALREGESVASASRIADYSAACTGGLCTAPEPVAGAGNTWTVVNRWETETPPYQAAATVTSGSLDVTPGYFIEYMGNFPNWVGCDRAEPMPVGCLGPRYRVTARATAPGRATVLLQSTFTSPE